MITMLGRPQPHRTHCCCLLSRFNMQVFYSLLMRQTADAMQMTMQHTAGVPLRIPGLTSFAFA